MGRFVTALMIILVLVSSSQSQTQTEPSSQQERSARNLSDRRSEELAELVSPISERFADRVVNLKLGTRQIGFGTIVSSDGQVLTKLSTLRGKIKIQFSDKDYSEYKVLGIDREHDLALLKIDANDLDFVQFGSSDFEIGRWTITPCPNSKPMVGIVSSEVREAKQSGFLGIQMDTKPLDKGIRIQAVVPNSPAESGGLRVNDLVHAINETAVNTPIELRKALVEITRGTLIEVHIQRGEERLTCAATLANRGMSPVLSDFPITFGHDTKLKRNTQSGGPLLNLDGNVIGLNVLGQFRGTELNGLIPNADSTNEQQRSNLAMAIPSEIVAERLRLLASGELLPSKVNAKSIEYSQLEIEKTEREIAELTQQLSVQDNQSRAALEKRLKTLSRQLEKKRSQLLELRRGF